MALNSFLINCKLNANSLLKTTASVAVHVVLGTEACDLDSAVSAVIYSYTLNGGSAETTKQYCLPILNTKRSSLRSKNEIIYAFEKFEVKPETFICIDEINLKELQDDGKLKITLVDHNILSTQNEFLKNEVIEIIDHHKNEIADTYENLKRVIIRPVGSCATLIAENIYATCPEILQNIDCSTLLYQTILLDTNNLSEETKKATLKDIEMVSKLETVLNHPNRSEIYESVLAARLDISGLTFEELLSRDLKVVSGNGLQIAIPTVVISLQNVQHLEEELAKFAIDNGYNAVVVMGVLISEDNVSRDISVFSKNETLLQGLQNAIMNAENGSLTLEIVSKNNYLVNYKQTNIKLSRKFVLPVVRDFLKEYNKN